MTIPLYDLRRAILCLFAPTTFAVSGAALCGSGSAGASPSHADDPQGRFSHTL